MRARSKVPESSRYPVLVSSDATRFFQWISDSKDIFLVLLAPWHQPSWVFSTSAPWKPYPCSSLLLDSSLWQLNSPDVHSSWEFLGTLSFREGQFHLWSYFLHFMFVMALGHQGQCHLILERMSDSLSSTSQKQTPVTSDFISLGDPLSFCPFLGAFRECTICKAEVMRTPRSKYSEFSSLAISPGSPWWLITQMLSEETSQSLLITPLKAHVSLYRLRKKNGTPDSPDLVLSGRSVLLWNINYFTDHHHRLLYNQVRTQTKMWTLSKLQKWPSTPHADQYECCCFFTIYPLQLLISSSHPLHKT